MVRRPAAAGMFYPDKPDELDRYITEMWPTKGQPQTPARAIVSPHAGYIYSGRVAANTVAGVTVPQSIIILGPNHRGLGAPAAIMDKGSWMMPGGDVSIDEELATLLMERCDILESDPVAHSQEHSLEVQIPILRRANPDLKIVPICLARSDLGACQEIGRAIAETMDAIERPVLMVASTDMTHYESQESARLKDNLAIDHILAMDPEGLYSTVMTQRITMCGVIPTVSVLYAAKQLGSSDVNLVQYTTSGEVSGDFNQVVGYAGMVIR